MTDITTCAQSCAYFMGRCYLKPRSFFVIACFEFPSIRYTRLPILRQIVLDDGLLDRLHQIVVGVFFRRVVKHTLVKRIELLACERLVVGDHVLSLFIRESWR